MKKGLFLMSVSVLMVLAGCSQSFEDKAVGHWVIANEDTNCLNEFEEGFRLNDDGSIEGVEMFKTYKIEEKDNGVADIVLDGALAETTRFTAKINDKGNMFINESDVKDSELESDALTCEMKKSDE